MLNLILPLRCIHCDSRMIRVGNELLSKYLCLDCHRIFNRLEAPRSDELQAQRVKFNNIDSVTSIIGGYKFELEQSLIQRMIHHAKYYSMMSLAIVMGRILGKTFRNEFENIDLIIPIPLHRTRYAERGFNQSDYFAKGVSDEITRPVTTTVLKRIKPTPTQTGLNADEREKNVSGAFALRRSANSTIKNKSVLLLDDVMTTGSTLSSAAAELDKASPKQIIILAISAVCNTEI